MTSFVRRALLVTAGSISLLWSAPGHAQVALLNVSYDVAREFYKEYNTAFAKHWKATTGEDIKLNQSHGGSSKQARAVIDGLDADVLTMNQALDIDMVADKGLVATDWSKRLPNNAAPTSSTIVIMVRKGNPKGIKDWADLVKPGHRSRHPRTRRSPATAATRTSRPGARSQGRRHRRAGA